MVSLTTPTMNLPVTHKTSHSIRQAAGVLAIKSCWTSSFLHMPGFISKQDSTKCIKYIDKTKNRSLSSLSGSLYVALATRKKTTKQNPNQTTNPRPQFPQLRSPLRRQAWCRAPVETQSSHFDSSSQPRQHTGHRWARSSLPAGRQSGPSWKSLEYLQGCSKL